MPEFFRPVILTCSASINGWIDMGGHWYPVFLSFCIFGVSRGTKCAAIRWSKFFSGWNRLNWFYDGNAFYCYEFANPRVYYKVERARVVRTILSQRQLGNGITITITNDSDSDPWNVLQLHSSWQDWC